MKPIDKKYREQHAVCPDCGRSSYRTTYAAYMYEPDENEVKCVCGWVGITHDLVSLDRKR